MSNIDRSGFKEVSDAAEERLDKVMKRVIKHDFTKQGGALLELDPFEDHMVSACWSRLSKHAREEEGVLTKKIKMTEEEIEEQPLSKRRKTMYKMALGTKEAIKAWKDAM